jgi:hypothetical protein
MASEGGEIDVVAELSRDEGGTVWLVLYYDQGFSFFFLQDGKFWPRDHGSLAALHALVGDE